MKNEQLENPDIAEMWKTKYPNGVFDILLEKHQTILRQSGPLKKIADQMDHYTKFNLVPPDRLANEHRWTAADIGKPYVGFEVPNGGGEGIVFEVVPVIVFGPSAISFVVNEAFELTFDQQGNHSVWQFGPFSDETTFAIDGSNPITWDQVDRTCAMLDWEETYDRFRVFMAIQDWALQPKHSFLS